MSDCEGIVFQMTGLDDVYTQQFSEITNTTGLISLDDVFYASYVVSATKENYGTISETITVTKNNHVFDLELINNYGIDDVTAISELFFKIYPNPTDGSFTLELIDENKAGDIQVSVYSMVGEIVIQKELTGQKQYDFDLSAEPGGIYLIRVIKVSDSGLMKIIRE